MTKRPTVTTLASGFNSTETLNTNFEALRDGFDNTLSLDGSTPNAMEADLDLNGNNIIGAVGLSINGTDYLAEVTAAKAAALVAQTAAELAETNAETAETNAETAETNAESSETAAAASAIAAATSATASAASAVDSTNNGAAQVVLAADQVTLAETAKTAAELAETNAETAEGNAATSATNAATSATTASTEASAASTKASEAATSATNAATSATESETAKTGAEAAKDAALAALDSFDDRYLGQKTTDPTVDNDGNALVSGSLYFNTTDDVMKVYDGSLWVAAYASLSGAMFGANNLSDVADAASSRQNLGLGTAATTASTAYATSSQGTLADSAVQPNDSPTFAGLTTTANVSFGDNDKAIFGAGSDLQIYHDGSKSYIDDLGTGEIVMRTNRFIIQDVTGTETLARFDQNSFGKLYYDDSQKLSTTSTGVNVTGTITSDGLTVDGNGSLLKLDNGSNPATISNTNGNVTLDFDTTNAGRSFNIEENGNTALRINNNGDISFYEDTGTTPKFFWDASAESLGIGTSSPSDTLDVASTTNGDPVRIRLTANDDGGTTRSGNLFFDPDTNTVGFRNGGSNRLHVGDDGNVGIGTSSPSAHLDIQSSGDTLVNVKSNGTGDADATLVLDSADTGESVLQFEHDGVYGAKLEWYTDGEPDLNVTTVGASSVIDMQPNGVRTGRFDTSGLEVTGTVTATSFSGDGSNLTGVGGSTDAYAVGTYAHVSRYTSTNHNIGDTTFGSNLFSWQIYSSSNVSGGTGSISIAGSSEGKTSTSFTGTWRWMSASSLTSTRSRFGLAVRIS